MADRLERAWAAGLFDGDGWAGARAAAGRRTRQPAAQINQASADGVPEVLVRFHAAVGGAGRVGGPQTLERRLPLYWWVASSRADVALTLEAIGPWLCDAKRAQFAVALGRFSTDPGRHWPHDPSEEVAWAAGLFDAEGCVSLAAHRSHQGLATIEASLTQLSAEPTSQVLDRFKQAMGGVGSINGPYVQATARRLVLRWRVHKTTEIATVITSMRSCLGPVKLAQADRAFAVVAGQPVLSRGNPSWGSHKTHCVHGHEYAVARVRPYHSRGVGLVRRENAQCLVCVRDKARAKRSARNAVGCEEQWKSGDRTVAALPIHVGGAATSCSRSTSC